MADSIPLTDEPDDLLVSHNYDGIQEYDNPTPGWWNWLFILTAVFAPLYVLWFHSPVSSRTLEAQYQEEKAANLKLAFGEIGELETTRANILAYMNEPKWVDFGKVTFATHCSQCHGAQGQGLTAPNLTDDYYIHVRQIEDIAKVVRQGAKAGSMPAWGDKLHPNEVLFVTCYVATLRGQNLSSAYADKGTEIPPWPEPPPADETASADSLPVGDGATSTAESAE